MNPSTQRGSPDQATAPMHHEPIAEIKVKGIVVGVLPGNHELGPRHRIALQHQDTDGDVEDSIYTPDEAASLQIGLEMAILWTRKHR